MSDYNATLTRPRVPRGLAILLASAALVVIGSLEAAESARQLGDVAGRPVLRAEGLGLSALGFAASALIYLALGWWHAADRAAIDTGALTGAIAGLIGGVTRAVLIAEPVTSIVERYAALPDWFIPTVLAIFVVLELIVSVVGGAILAFAGVRLRRMTRAGARERG